MADMVRRLCWTVIFGCIVAAIMLSILLAWKPTR